MNAVTITIKAQRAAAAALHDMQQCTKDFGCMIISVAILGHVVVRQVMPAEERCMVVVDS